ncbi:hypothetical protein ACLOJK_012026 [Asimina triloba]
MACPREFALGVDMAAGRHGGYRRNEFRDREMSLGFSGRKDFCYYKEEYGRLGEGARERDLKRLKERDYRDRARFSWKEVKERGSENLGFQPSLTTSDSGSRTGGRKKSEFFLGTTELEPGELSSGSGSDDAEKSELLGRRSENGCAKKSKSPPSRKRKFSPVVWDVEEKKVCISLMKRIDSTNISMPPSCPQGFSQSQSIEQCEVAEPSLIPRSCIHQPIPKPPSAPGSPQSIVLASPNGLLPASPVELLQGNHHEAQQIGEEGCFPIPNIVSSRWADDGNTSCDEGEVSVDEDLKERGKKTPVDESAGRRVNTKVSSPESGEILREDSEAGHSKSSTSGGKGIHAQMGSKDENTEISSEYNYHMDVDGEISDAYVRACQAEPDAHENNSPKSPEPTLASPRSRSMLQGCRSIREFEKLNRIDEGTYGVVFRAKDKKSGKIVALKKVKMEKEREGFPLTALREINILLSCHHPSIVDIKEVVVGSTLDSIFMVMEYMPHDLKGLMELRNQPFSQSEVKCLMLQLLEGVKYLHQNWILHRYLSFFLKDLYLFMHLSPVIWCYMLMGCLVLFLRDLKMSNILMNNWGELKICDFGLARQYGSPLKPYTLLVVTLWYRAPELLLGAKEYSTAIDMWSIGCIMAELLAKIPLFNGKTEFDQLDKIFRTLGTPNEKIWPGFTDLPGAKANFVKQSYNRLREKFPPTAFLGQPTISEAGFDLLNKLLTYDPDKRITAEAALNHEWFQEVPLPQSKEFMPTYPPQHDHDRRLQKALKNSDPLEEQQKKALHHGDSGMGADCASKDRMFRKCETSIGAVFRRHPGGCLVDEDADAVFFGKSLKCILSTAGLARKIFSNAKAVIVISLILGLHKFKESRNVMLGSCNFDECESNETVPDVVTISAYLVCETIPTLDLLVSYWVV